MRPNGAAYRRLPVVPRLPDLVSDRWRPAEWNSACTGKVRPGIAPRDVIVRAPMTSAPVQRLASWASLVPPLRRAAYEIAGMAFARRFVFRMSDVPVSLCQDFLARNQQVYETMCGPSEFFATAC
jgi:hypothetical protein